ncbi:MAG TPA: FecR domain-containing protein [Phycisphaerae bacterium]|nr:FecR domain-containing protein [Phycisphaerae bacterium]
MKTTQLIAIIGLLGITMTVWGRPATTQPTAAAPSTQPASRGDPMQARIIQVSGRVQHATVDAAGNIGEWRDAKVGDELPAGTRVRTRLRSNVVLAFGDDSVVMIDRATLASIDQFHRSADTKVVRLGLGHGAIRAGVAETTLRSDMTIETPTATLSKKGTIDFGIEYEPSSGRFRVFLAREGLVEALNKLTQERRNVLTGQYVTQAMIRWITTATFDRHVALADLFGMTGSEKWFNALNGSGLGAVDPGGGMGISSLGSGAGQGQVGGGFGQNFSRSLPTVTGPTGPQAIDRPEGNFGTGGAIVPRIFGDK